MSNLKNRIIELEKENENLKKYIKELEIKLNTKTKNERNAGRKKKLSDQDIEQIKMYRIQKKTIEEIAQMFNVSVGLIHKTLKNNERLTEKVAKIEMWLRVENNNKFVRGKTKVREAIERYLRFNYKMEKQDIKGCEYIFYVPYKGLNDLEKTVYDAIGEMAMEADFRNCFIECDVRCDELGLSW